VSLLDGIVAHVSRRVARLKHELPPDALRARPGYARPPRGLDALLAPGSSLRVAEVRFASPECGFRVPRASATAEEAVRLGRAALAGGAAALSVLVERHFHAGDWEHLAAVRAALPDACLIARDFVLEEYQLELARAHGADAVTLSAAVSSARTPELAEAARALGLGVVVEARDEAQLGLGRRARPGAVLVPARRPEDFTGDLSAARRLVPLARRRSAFVEISAASERTEAAELAGVWMPADLC